MPDATDGWATLAARLSDFGNDSFFGMNIGTDSSSQLILGDPASAFALRGSRTGILEAFRQYELNIYINSSVTSPSDTTEFGEVRFNVADIPSTVPEPSSVVLLAIGAVGTALTRRGKTQNWRR